MTIHNEVNVSCCEYEILEDGSFKFSTRKGDVILSDGDTINGGNWGTNMLVSNDTPSPPEMPLNLIFENKPNMRNWNLTGSNTGKCSNAKVDDCYNYWMEKEGANFRNLQPEEIKCRHAVVENFTIDGVEKEVIVRYENHAL